MLGQRADLERVAGADPAVAPLARLQAVALAAAEQPGWAAGVPPLQVRSDDAPLLDGQTLLVDGDTQRALLVELTRALDAVGSSEGRVLRRLFLTRTFDPLALLAASVTQDGPALRDAAREGGGDDVVMSVVSVVAHVAALPLLLACGQHAASALEDVAWPHGSCPVCGAYPTLQEMRGLARDRVLRCGRCATGWAYPHGRCPFCASDNQRSQGYFAAEADRESRRAVTCDDCQGYVKSVATLGPLPTAYLLVRDLETLELDVAALEHGYRRPDRLGWQLSVRMAAAPPKRSAPRLRWWSR